MYAVGLGVVFVLLQIDPTGVVNAYATAGRKLGVKIFEHTGAAAIETATLRDGRSEVHSAVCVLYCDWDYFRVRVCVCVCVCACVTE